MPRPKRSLPVLAPIRPISLAWFDATTTSRLALDVLRETLGSGATTRVARGVIRRAVLDDPTRALPPPKTRDEKLTRSQLRSVVLLDTALRLDLGMSADDAREVVRQVVRTSGAAFLQRFFAGFAPEDWDAADDDERARFADALAARIFNAEVRDVVATRTSLAFDVTLCRFADSLAALGRMDLAPLFCEVDAALVEREDVPFSLERASTLAAGGDLCRFRFSRRT